MTLPYLSFPFLLVLSSWHSPKEKKASFLPVLTLTHVAVSLSEREKLGLTVFHDTKQAYIEINVNLTKRYALGFPVAEQQLYPLISQIKKSIRLSGNSLLTGQPFEYSMTEERRRQVKIKAMLPVGRDLEI